MIQKIVDKIHNEEYTMKHLESVQAIDFETIIIIDGSVGWTIEDILKDNGYRIYKTNKYKIIDGEVCDEEDIYRKQYEIRQESDDHEIGYRKFREWYKPTKTITEIKIEKDEFYLKNLYKKWKKEEEEEEKSKYNAFIKVKDVIEALQKFDQNLIIGFEDHEFGGFHTIRKYQWNDDDDDEDYENDSMAPRLREVYECPDCSRGCCHHCKGREIFKKKFVIL